MYTLKICLHIIAIIYVDNISCLEDSLLFTAMQEFGFNHPISIKTDVSLYVKLAKQLYQNGKYTNFDQEESEICKVKVKNQFQVIIKGRRSITLAVLKDSEFDKIMKGMKCKIKWKYV